MPRRPKQFHFIYKTTCQITGKYYVGMHSTDNIDDGYLGSGKLLRRSITKHGRENHTLSIVEFCSCREELKSRESTIVNEELLADGLCMNLKCGGEGGSDSHTPETKQKISLARKGQVNNMWSAESREKIAEYRTGRTHTDETKAKVSRANSGLKRTEEFKSQVSATLKARSAEIAERQRQAIKGRSFYNDGEKTILVFADDPRLSDPKWTKGKK